jgi:hypothetical protein
MLSLCSYHPSALLKATAALLGCSVEKECKLDIMRYAGYEMITLLRVRAMQESVRCGHWCCLSETSCDFSKLSSRLESCWGRPRMADCNFVFCHLLPSFCKGSSLTLCKRLLHMYYRNPNCSCVDLDTPDTHTITQTRAHTNAHSHAYTHTG